MRLSLIPLGILITIIATACSETDAPNTSDFDDGYAASESVQFSRSAPPPPAPPPPPPPPGEPANAVDESVQRLIAYRYDYRLETPAEQTPLLIAAHQTACESAGASVCQIVNANTYQDGAGHTNGVLNLRASPDWVRQFIDGLGAEVEDAGGDIRSQTQSAEDLTSTIMDTAARLDAKRVLRDRLTVLLTREGATVEELVQVERELARLQGDIEGTMARLRAMRGRVSMSSLSINYTSTVEPVRPGAVSPIGRALNQLLETVSRGLADVITFIGGSAPWLIVILPVLWFIRRWVGGMLTARRAAAKPKDD
jgi:hypothetical protein